MSTTVDYDLPPVKELTAEESRAFIESEAQRLLGIGIDEFIRRLDAGEYDEVLDAPGHRHLGYLEDLSHVVR